MAHLEEVIRHDKEAQQDRIVAVFSEDDGWYFGCDEQKSASDEVQACLNEHEAICFRPKDEGPNRHELPAMVGQLLAKLGGCSARIVADSDVNVILPSIREQLDIAHQKEQVLRQEVANGLQRERDLLAHIAALTAPCLIEAVPPA